MLDAARNGIAVIEGIDFDTFSRDTTRKLALERAMEIVGEAARRVSLATRDAHPELPWRLIIGQRNIIAHEYGRIDHAQLYRTALEDLPGLIEILARLLPPC
jgi:uncharacterized protein with HEPN domain